MDEETINFALMIRKRVGPDGGNEMHIETRNQGIPDPEVMLIIEAWLERARENFKKPIKDNMKFVQDKSES